MCAAQKKQRKTHLVLFIILAILLFVLLLTVVLHIRGCLLLPLHPPFSELLHHLKKLLAIILEKVICDGENVARS